MTLTIIIASYEAEKRIELILNDLKFQVLNEDFKIKIVVYVDKGKDNTYDVANSFKMKNYKVSTGSNRLGFGGVIKKFVKENKSDFIMILNDDIRITDKNFLTRICNELKKSNSDFFCTDIRPIKGNFLQNANLSSFFAYRKMAYEMNDGNNVFTVDGKVMILSKKFMKKLKFPKKLSDMGNVDCFLYFSCLSHNLKYKLIKKAFIEFVFPSNLNEYVKWTSRNNSNEKLLIKRFGKIVKESYQKPNTLMFYKIIETIKNPLGSILIYLLSFKIKFDAKKISSNFNPKWDTIKSTKVITF